MLEIHNVSDLLKFLAGLYLTMFLFWFVCLQYACIEYQDDPTEPFEKSYDPQTQRLRPTHRCQDASHVERKTCSLDQVAIVRRNVATRNASHTNQPRRTR